jgi:protein-tyrosine phosphatase
MNGNQQKPPFLQAVRKIVPGYLLRERQVFLRLGPKAGPIYARLRLLDSLGVHSPNRNRIQPDARSFLFVCFGNIMRSPMAEAMFRKSIEGANLYSVRICSAGLHAVPGNKAHPRSMAASQEIGLSLAEHRARLLTSDLVSQADAIFVMDFQNKAEMLALYPKAGNKILMLSTYADGPTRYREIPDPYFGDLEATRNCYAVLQTCIRNLTLDLVAHHNIRGPLRMRTILSWRHVRGLVEVKSRETHGE